MSIVIQRARQSQEYPPPFKADIFEKNLRTKVFLKMMEDKGGEGRRKNRNLKDNL